MAFVNANKNTNIEDGGLTSISENLAVIFYHKKPQESFHYNELEDSFNVLVAYLEGMHLQVLRMNTKESPTEKIVRTILDAVNNYPNTFFLVPIVYKSKDEKEAIMRGIKKGLSDPKTPLKILIRA